MRLALNIPYSPDTRDGVRSVFCPKIATPVGPARPLYAGVEYEVKLRQPPRRCIRYIKQHIVDPPVRWSIRLQTDGMNAALSQEGFVRGRRCDFGVMLGPLAAYPGLVPRQNGTGGKTRLGGIGKRGDAYLYTHPADPWSKSRPVQKQA